MAVVARISTVAFQGIETRTIETQVQLSGGLPSFTIVGLPDKAVGESRERVRSALLAMGLSLPPKRITVNLAPADVAKEGSHFDLPIALGLLVATGVLAGEEMEEYLALGELGLDGTLRPVAGVLPAAIHANGMERGFICPQACGPEAAWAGDARTGFEVLAPPTLLHLVNHFKGTQVLGRPAPTPVDSSPADRGDLRDVKGQESAKRVLEIAAAGGHNLLMIGPPGAGKSMLASRLPGLLPETEPHEMLDLSRIHSVAGMLTDGKLVRRRPFRDPHHSASLVALVGGGSRVRPGEISLAHRGVLFLDELPEFSRQALESLRQPLETGQVSIARANAHVTFPARFQLVAAMNPCRCGYLSDPSRACSRAPRCGQDYQAKVSGPILDRIDLHLDVPAVSARDLSLPPPLEGTAEVAARVGQVRRIQAARFADYNRDRKAGLIETNADADGQLLAEVATPDTPGRMLLADAAVKLGLSARGWHRLLRVARTVADLQGADRVGRPHIAEALAFRGIGASGV